MHYITCNFFEAVWLSDNYLRCALIDNNLEMKREEFALEVNRDKAMNEFRTALKIAALKQDPEIQRQFVVDVFETAWPEYTEDMKLILDNAL